MSDGCTAFYFGKQRLGPDLTMDSQCVRDIIQGKKEQADRRSAETRLVPVYISAISSKTDGYPSILGVSGK